jgi:rfaE bifunctional protein kinase chain/domain
VREDLLDIVSRFEDKKVLVLGDVMLDEYIVGRVSRISPEAPVPVVACQKVFYSPGGAANVSMNISGLGGKAYLVGLVGDDREGEQLKNTFVNNGINIEGVMVDPGRPTTLKTRIVAQGQHLVRVDRESPDPISDATVQNLISYALGILDDVDVVLISDYAKGVTVPTLLQEIIQQAKTLKKPVVVGPKGHDYAKYRGATVVIPNKKEAGEATNSVVKDEEGLVRAGHKLLTDLACEAVLITRGEEGMSLFQGNGDVIHVPTVAQQVYDVTGAGDTVVATLSLALAAGAGWVNGAQIANHAAGIVVGKTGTAVVLGNELESVLRDCVKEKISR